MNGLVMANTAQRVADAFSNMGERERRTLAFIAERLLVGQQTFGELYHSKKDWKHEASEEAFDMAVYLAAKLCDDEDDAPDTVRDKVYCSRPESHGLLCECDQ